MQTLSSVTNVLEMQHKATARIAWAVSTDSWTTDDPIAAMRERGHGRYLPTAFGTKAAVSPITTADAAVALMPLDTAFLGLVDAESVLGKLDGAVRLPLMAAARLQVGEVHAAVVSEADIKPVMRLDFDTIAPPTKAEAQIVISSEALRNFDPATQDGIRAVLVSAVAAAVDRELVTMLTGSAPTAGTVEDLLAAVSGGQPRKPYLLGGFDMLLALPAGTLRDLRDLAIGVVPTPAAQGALIMVDVSGLLIQDAGVEVAVARHASLAMDDGGGGGPTVNLWQSNLSCLRAERMFRLALRAGAAAWASVGTP
jgi:hypothetical protein